MAFVVEDGSGDADATAYIAVAEFKSHHDDRGRSYVDHDDADIMTAIVKATDYVDKRFGSRFKGIRRQKDQGLEWPRLSAFDNDGFLMSGVDVIPRNLKKAIAEYALIVLRLLDNELLPIPARPFATIDEETGEVSGGVSGQVIRNREKVGPLEIDQWFSDMARNSSGAVAIKSSLVDDLHIPEYPRADLWIEELLRSSMSTELVRGN
jgi:hypothetical protein